MLNDDRKSPLRLPLKEAIKVYWLRLASFFKNGDQKLPLELPLKEALRLYWLRLVNCFKVVFAVPAFFTICISLPYVMKSCDDDVASLRRTTDHSPSDGQLASRHDIKGDDANTTSRLSIPPK